MNTDYCKHMVPLMKNDTCHICSLEAERDQAIQELRDYKAERGENLGEMLDARAEADRLRIDLEEAREENQSLRRSLTSQAVKDANYNVEIVRLRKELEEERKIRFPRQADGEGGWTIDYKFLERLDIRILKESDFSMDLEDIEQVLLFLEKVLGQEGEGNQ